MGKKQVKPIGECKRKKSCYYGKTFDARNYYCDYLCMTGKMRPCTADSCTVYKRKGRSKNLNKTVDK